MKKIILILLMTALTFAASYNKKILTQIHQSDHNQTRFSFAVLGDNRDGDDIFRRMVAQIDRDRNLSFVINNGDLVSLGKANEYTMYMTMIREAGHPWLSVIGNHEIYWHGGRSRYREMFGAADFAFAYGNSYFIIIDTSRKRIETRQLHWLKHELQTARKYTHTFVLTHVPLYDPRKGTYARGHSFRNIDNARRLNDLLDRYDVTMLFTSHIHYYHRGVWHQTPYIITGGAGAPLRGYSRNGFYHYIRVVVEGKKVKYEVVKLKK